MYLAGPGDVLGTYRSWTKGEHDIREVALTYSGQFFDVVAKYGAQALVVAWPNMRGRVKEDSIEVRLLPIPLAKSRHIIYYVGQILYAARIWLMAARFRPQICIVSNAIFLAPLIPLRLLGIKIVPSLHCVLWPKYHKSGMGERWSLRLSRSLFSQHAYAILSISHDCSEQVENLTKGRHAPIVRFLPQYHPEFLERFENESTSFPEDKIRLLYAGRIEINKGVFDLVEMMKRVTQETERTYHLDICGVGGALPALRAAVKHADLDAMISVHGHCEQDRMLNFFKDCHIVLVPTRTDFDEGFNKVVAEGIIAGKPVITSAVCPALQAVIEAVEEVTPNDPQSYADAVLSLSKNRERYMKKCTAARQLRHQFFDREKGFQSAIEHVLKHYDEQTTPEPRLA